MTKITSGKAAWRRLIYRVSVLLVLMCSLIFVCFYVQAAMEGSCSINVDAKYDHKPLEGFQVSLYRVADLNEDQSAAALEKFSSVISDDDLTDLHIAANNEKVSGTLLGKLKQMKVTADAGGVTRADGICSLSDLPAGLYLMEVENKDCYEFTPGLICAPQYSPEGGIWYYDVQVEPKIARTPEPETPTSEKVIPERPIPEPPTPPVPRKEELPPVKTGDNAKTGSYLLILAFAGAAAVAVILVINKKHEE